MSYQTRPVITRSRGMLALTVSCGKAAANLVIYAPFPVPFPTP